MSVNIEIIIIIGKSIDHSFHPEYKIFKKYDQQKIRLWDTGIAGAYVESKSRSAIIFLFVINTKSRVTSSRALLTCGYSLFFAHIIYFLRRNNNSSEHTNTHNPYGRMTETQNSSIVYVYVSTHINYDQSLQKLTFSRFIMAILFLVSNLNI